MPRRAFALIALAMAGLALPAAAAEDGPYCEDLWFARNLIFDRAGYCFGSPLGQALFDNADCTEAAPDLPPDLAARVAQIRALEAEFSCAIDTDRTSLTYEAELNEYRAMIDVPIRGYGESGCIGYRGAPVAVHAGAGPDTPVIGQILPGMSIGFAHWPLNGWDFVSVHPEGFGTENVKSGWVRLGEGPPPCDGYAG